MRAIPAVLLVVLSACAHPVTRIMATEQPGHAVLSFPYDARQRGAYTTFLSNPATQVSGVDGRVLTITITVNDVPAIDELTIDEAGDLGIAGSIRAHGSIATVSTRAAKTDIAPFTDDALAILDRTEILRYRYRGDARTAGPRIGFIAEDTPAILSGPRHDRFDLTNTAAVDVAATKELAARIATLEKTVRALRRALASRAS